LAHPVGGLVAQSARRAQVCDGGGSMTKVDVVDVKATQIRVTSTPLHNTPPSGERLRGKGKHWCNCR